MELDAMEISLSVNEVSNRGRNGIRETFFFYFPRVLTRGGR